MYDVITVSGITKKYGKVVSKAKTLSSGDIRQLVDYLRKSGEFKDVRSSIFFLVQYLLFARFEEVASLKKENFIFLDSGDLKITIPKAKNYDVSEGKTSYISKGVKFNPVQLIKDYLLKIENTDFAFPNFKRGKNGCLVFKQGAVTYSNMLNILRRSLDAVGLCGRNYSLHSLRTGSLSEAANANVDKQILQRHGRWKSSSMVNYYHQLSIDKKLAASKALSLYD